MTWWRGAVIYQIYPRSFMDSNGDGVGDLAGALAKLDYVARLGVDGVWLSPFFRSPMKDYGYDVSDYRDVDPLFGTRADFDAFLARAHALGLKVIIDQVYSHTSDAHAWFAESRQSRDNPKSDWYVWADAKPDGTPPNNWQGMFGGAAWEWDARRRQYYLHNFLTEQPDLNVRNGAVQDALLDVARYWLDRGVDGFRLDVANYYVEDALLRDNPPLPLAHAPARPHQFQRHLHDRSQPETLAFLARLRALTEAYEARMMVGEIEDEDALARQIEYTDGPDRLHTAYSFYLLRQRALTPAIIAEAMAGWDGAAGWPSWSLSNHDVPRAATRIAHDEPARVRQALALLLLLRGTIFLYQGEELGLPDAHVPFENLRDPEAIRFWPKGVGRDGARTPMPWTRAGGFSTSSAPWLPLDARHLTLAVETQEADETSTLAFTRRLIALRRAHRALRTGAWRLLRADGAILAFERADETASILCVFNLAPEPGVFAHDALARMDMIQSGLPAQLSAQELRLPPWGGAILARRR